MDFDRGLERGWARARPRERSRWGTGTRSRARRRRARAARALGYDVEVTRGVTALGYRVIGDVALLLVATHARGGGVADGGR